MQKHKIQTTYYIQISDIFRGSKFAETWFNFEIYLHKQIIIKLIYVYVIYILYYIYILYIHIMYL